MQRPGTLVLVVGPSGAGKDTLIAAAKADLAGEPGFVFPRRVVTRAAMATLEDHDSVTVEEFALREAHGAYALSWEAHGLRYGLPIGLVDDLDAGRVVVMNGSRAMSAAAVEKYPGTKIVMIDATPEVRAERLAGRGRESAEEIAGRLRREVSLALPDAIRIDNSGPLAEGVALFVATLRGFGRS